MFNLNTLLPKLLIFRAISLCWFQDDKLIFLETGYYGGINETEKFDNLDKSSLSQPESKRLNANWQYWKMRYKNKAMANKIAAFLERNEGFSKENRGY